MEVAQRVLSLLCCSWSTQGLGNLWPVGAGDSFCEELIARGVCEVQRDGAKKWGEETARVLSLRAVHACAKACFKMLPKVRIEP